MNVRRLASALVVFLASAGCESGKGPQGNSAGVVPVAAAAGKVHVRPIFMRGPSGGTPIAPFVAAELQKGRAGHYGDARLCRRRRWCEPCRQFHKAVLAGELDTLLDGVHLVEFDLDADRDALSAAGYSSHLIPLFALPKANGSGSTDRIEELRQRSGRGRTRPDAATTSVPTEPSVGLDHPQSRSLGRRTWLASALACRPALRTRRRSPDSRTSAPSRGSGTNASASPSRTMTVSACAVSRHSIGPQMHAARTDVDDAGERLVTVA